MGKNLIQYGTFILIVDFPNLLVNGDFSDGLNGWTLVGDSGLNSISVAGGECTIVRGGVPPAHITQDIAIIPGSLLTIQYEMTDVSAGKESMDMGSSSEGQQSNTGIVGWHAFTPLAGESTPTAFFARGNLDPSDVTFDNIFARQKIPWEYVEDWDLSVDGSARFISSSNDNRAALSQVIGAIDGELYKVQFTVENWTPASAKTSLRYSVSGGTVLRIYDNAVVSNYVFAGSSSTGLVLQAFLDTLGDTFNVSDVSVEHVTSGSNTDTIIITGASVIDFDGDDENTGPNGEYVITEAQNDGKSVWDSVSTHPDGSGGLATWSLWWDSASTKWVVGLNVGTIEADGWEVVSSNDDPSNLTYAATGDAIGSPVSLNGVGTPEIDRNDFTRFSNTPRFDRNL